MWLEHRLALATQNDSPIYRFVHVIKTSFPTAREADSPGKVEQFTTAGKRAAAEMSFTVF